MRLSALLDPKTEYVESDLPLGSHAPTHDLVPPCQFTHGHDAIDLASLAGYDLLEFQRQGLIDKLGANIVELRDGRLVERWAAQDTSDVISRRNGKSVEIEVLILAGLFILGEKQIMYTAHLDSTAASVFNHVVAAIKRTPRLWAELVDKGPRYANGQRSITLRNGAVAYFRTRTGDTARGEGFNRLILDESQNLTDEQMAALSPLVSGEPNAQINYAGSAGGLTATVQAKVWASYEKGERGLCYRGWHCDPDDDFDDLDLIARLNPRLGIGLSYEFVAKEFARLTRSHFGRERCGVSTYPRADGASWVIPEKAWTRDLDESSIIAPAAVPAFVLEADPVLEMGTIGTAGRRPDGAMHVEVIAHDPGVAWMVDRAKKLQDDHSGDVWVDPKGPCGFMLGDLAEAGVAVKLFDAEDLKNAWTWFYTNANPQPDPKDPDRALPEPGVRHRGGALMTQALASAELRKMLDRHTLRRSVANEVNQGPIVAGMLAAYAVVKVEREKPPPDTPLPRRAGQRAAPERTPPGRGTGRSRPRKAQDVARAGF